MTIYKCKICGGNLSIDDNSNIAVCEYCGTKQTVPHINNERIANLYDRANHLRRNNDFDKASALYEQIISEDRSDAEAYWSLVLCRYGIEYVEDPATHKRIPTINRAQYDSVFNDEDYRNALKYANDEAKTLYKSEAEYIDGIQKEILSISLKEEPYDIFICYKETDSYARRTIDSVLAQDIYNNLTEEGYKVFFSRITLEDKLGVAYEPYIFAALNSAKVMLVVSTSKENINSVWVKNEWSRYLSLIAKDHSKTLIPLYKDMSPYDLPEEFSYLQGQDMNKIGFMQDLVYGINKILNRSRLNSNAENEKKLLIRLFDFLEDGRFKEAEEYCERILDQNPECAKAYLGKLMVECKAKKQDDLAYSSVNIENSTNYHKILRYGDEILKKTVQGYCSDNKEIINKKLQEETTTKDVPKKSATKWVPVIGVLSIVSLLFLFVIPAVKYESALSFLKNGQYEEAYSAFTELANFKDSIKKADEANKSLKYQEALNFINEGNDSAAYEILSEIDDFKESEEIKSSLSKKKQNEVTEGIKVGSYVRFGTYTQSNNTTKEDIWWRVLAVESDRVLLITENGIDNMQYNSSSQSTTWENCTLRSWLNDTFYNEAFNELEQSIIEDSYIITADNPKYYTDAGSATNDKLFLLSIDEALNYFSSDDDRLCYATQYTKSKGAYVGDSGACHWWLRTPGETQTAAAGVASFGKIYYDGNLISKKTGSVRPALWLSYDN